MKRAAFVLMVSIIAAAIVMWEIEFLNGRSAAIVLAAATAATLMFSLARQPRKKEAAIMAHEGEETLDVKGFGTEVKLKGAGVLSKNSLTVIAACALVFAIYKHHTDNEAALTRIYEAMAENTYVLSLPQAEREKLQIQIPESLRRKMRHRVND